MNAPWGRITYLRADDSLLPAFAARLASWDWDFKRGLVFFCPRGATFFGLSRAEGALGCSFERATRLVHPEDIGLLTDRIRASLPGGKFEATYRVGLPETGYRRLHAFGSCTADENGEPIRFPGIVIDISDLPELESSSPYDVACDHLLLAHQAALGASDHVLAELCEAALRHVAISTASAMTFKTLN